MNVQPCLLQLTACIVRNTSVYLVVGLVRIEDSFYNPRVGLVLVLVMCCCRSFHQVEWRRSAARVWRSPYPAFHSRRDFYHIHRHFLPLTISSPTSGDIEKYEPGSRERAKALVCDNCWMKCFDTEGIEKLGRQEIKCFEYTVSVASIVSSIRIEYSNENLHTPISKPCLVFCQHVDDEWVIVYWA